MFHKRIDHVKSTHRLTKGIYYLLARLVILSLMSYDVKKIYQSRHTMVMKALKLI